MPEMRRTAPDRYLIISTDGHCGADLRVTTSRIWRARYHDDFDDWAANYHDPWGEVESGSDADDRLRVLFLRGPLKLGK